MSYYFDNSANRVSRHEAAGPIIHKIQGWKGKPVEVLHAKAQQLSMDLMVDPSLKIKKGFIALSLLVENPEGEIAGIYNALTADDAEALADSLRIIAAKLRQALKAGVAPKPPSEMSPMEGEADDLSSE